MRHSGRGHFLSRSRNLWMPGPQVLPRAGGPGGDPDTVLLVHWDGENEATAAVDESNSAHDLNFQGDAQLKTSEKVFGTAALHLPNTAAKGHVEVPNSSDFQFGTDPFTVETRHYYDQDTNTFQYLVAFSAGGGLESWYLAHDTQSTTHRLIFAHSSDGSSPTFLFADANMTTKNWYALAADWDGTTLRLYRDGSVIASTTSFSGVFATTEPLRIGNSKNEALWATGGRFDETRISTVARYAGAYTPATEAFAA